MNVIGRKKTETERERERERENRVSSPLLLVFLAFAVRAARSRVFSVCVSVRARVCPFLSEKERKREREPGEAAESYLLKNRLRAVHLVPFARRGRRRPALMHSARDGNEGGTPTGAEEGDGDDRPIDRSDECCRPSSSSSILAPGSIRSLSLARRAGERRREGGGGRRGRYKRARVCRAISPSAGSDAFPRDRDAKFRVDLRETEGTRARTRGTAN